MWATPTPRGEPCCCLSEHLWEEQRKWSKWRREELGPGRGLAGLHDRVFPEPLAMHLSGTALYQLMDMALALGEMASTLPPWGRPAHIPRP